MIDTLLFDLDDTLVAYEAVTDVSWRQACGTLLSPDLVPLETACQTIQKHSSRYWSDEERSRAGRQDMVSARRAIVGSAFEELGLPEEQAVQVADLFSKVRIDNMYVLPGAVETLSRFQAKGLKMALITNGDSAGQRAKISRFGLARFFSSVLIEGELGIGKPDPRVFREAMRQLDSESRHALMVGDNLIWDVEGARAVGIRGVWFNWKKAPLPIGVVPHAVITELPELIDVVRQT